MNGNGRIFRFLILIAGLILHVLKWDEVIESVVKYDGFLALSIPGKIVLLSHPGLSLTAFVLTVILIFHKIEIELMEFETRRMHH